MGREGSFKGLPEVGERQAQVQRTILKYTCETDLKSRIWAHTADFLLLWLLMLFCFICLFVCFVLVGVFFWFCFVFIDWLNEYRMESWCYTLRYSRWRHAPIMLVCSPPVNLKKKKKKFTSKSRLVCDWPVAGRGEGAERATAWKTTVWVQVVSACLLKMGQLRQPKRAASMCFSASFRARVRVLEKMTLRYVNHPAPSGWHLATWSCSLQRLKAAF